MSFEFDIDVIASELNMRKSNIKRLLKKFGFEKGKDYIENPIKINDEKKHGGHNKILVLATEACYNQLKLDISLNNKNIIIDKNIKIDYIKRYTPKETEIIGFIYDVVSPIYDVKKEYKVLNYRIDLYIIDKKIAIECDEFGHKYYDKDKDIKRQEEIIKELDCKFIRFNPDDESFKLSQVITDLIRLCISTS